MKKFSEISRQLKKSSYTENYCNYDRDSFVSGKMFKIGEIVEHKGRTAEIISVGTNYLTLIRDGKTFKTWITEISSLPQETHDSLPKKVDGNLSYKGYLTKNFNNEICDLFIESFSGVNDIYAYYNCIVSCDSILGVKSNALIEYYNKYNIMFEKVSRYLKKIGLSIPRINVIGEALELIRENN